MFTIGNGPVILTFYIFVIQYNKAENIQELLKNLNVFGLIFPGVFILDFT